MTTALGELVQVCSASESGAASSIMRSPMALYVVLFYLTTASFWACMYGPMLRQQHQGLRVCVTICIPPQPRAPVHQ